MKSKTLLRELYWELKEAGLFSNIEEFIDLVFPYYKDFGEIKKALSTSRNFGEEGEDDYKICKKYILDEEKVHDEYGKSTLKKIRLDIIEKFIKNISQEQLSKLKDLMIDLLKETNIHDEILCKRMILFIERLKVYGKVESTLEKKWRDEWINAIYYYIYFAVTDRVYSDVAHSTYEALNEDLEEYNTKITLAYGASGNPGMYQLYAMAEREKPNIIALYECGELEYYGKGPSGKVNWQKAYDFYEKTLKYNMEHPLASWSMAYMRFDYSQQKAKAHPEYRVQRFEDELIAGKSRTWFQSILGDAWSSYNNGCMAAANLLGKIASATDEEFPTWYRGEIRGVPAKELYKESAEGGYVYGCNNYAQSCLNEAGEVEDSEEKKRLYKEAVYYIEKSAGLGEPWASNRLGLYCLKGFTYDGEILVEKDMDKAYKLFEYSSLMMYAETYFWPLINLCEAFWLKEDSPKYLLRSEDEIAKELKAAIDFLCDDRKVKKIKEIEIIAQNKKLRELLSRIRG